MTILEVIHNVAQRHLASHPSEPEILSFPQFALLGVAPDDDTDEMPNVKDDHGANGIDGPDAGDRTPVSAVPAPATELPNDSSPESSNAIPAAAPVEKGTQPARAGEPRATDRAIDPASGRREPDGEVQASLPHRRMHGHFAAEQRCETRDVTRGLTSPARRVEMGLAADQPDGALSLLAPRVFRAAEQPDKPQPMPAAMPPHSAEPDRDPMHEVSTTIDEGSRRMTQSLGDLESSLARLFQTQIEALQRLRERALEQERRWIDQAALRRI